MKIFLYPTFSGEDQGDGGIRRVVEAQRRYYPEYGVEIVEEEKDADLIAAHIEIPPAFTNKMPTIPIVLHCHGLYWAEYNWGNWQQETNSKIMESMRQADAVTAPTFWVSQVLRRNIAKRIIPIRHGIDADEWQIRPSGGYVFWNKNRPDPVCDPEAVTNLARMMPNQQFVTTFSDTELPNIRVIGRTPFVEAKQILEEAAVYLCSSRETYGIGTLEALAAGVPVVGWRWGGQREIIRHGETGWLSTPGDYEDLMKGVEWALENRDKLAPKLRADAERNFGWRPAIEKYVQLYEQTLALREIRTPKVSVIVTAYNLAEFLPDCLNSVQGQTFKDWECIVVDDASPDNCGAIAEEFAAADPRFKVIHNEKNQYLAEARNIGIAASNGEYILPLDADDMLPEAAVAILTEALDKDRHIHISYGRVRFLESDGKTWYSDWPIDFSFSGQIAPPSGEMGRPMNFVPYSAMYRRDVWAYTGGYRRRCRTTEDADFWCRTTSYGFRPSKVTSMDTLIYRNRENSMSRSQHVYDWSRWFPWSRDPGALPAGAVTEKQVPIRTFEPVAVSVIIPVGPEHADMVFDAIDSVDAQTFRDWECIVIDDTGGLLKRERLPTWVRCFITIKGPKGVAAARNLGVKKAQGKVFIPLDADDYLQPDAVKVMYDTWKEYGGYVYTDWWEDWGNGDLRIWRTKDYQARNLLHGCLHAVTGLYPVSAWESIGGFDESLTAWEDWDFQLSLADKAICGVRVAEPLWVYRKFTGKRREENQAAFEDSKASILKKWGSFWEGHDLMGCSGCGSRTVRALPTPPPPSRGMRPTNGDVILIQYTGSREGAIQYKGRVTGAVYTFSSQDNVKYVYVKDADMFVGRSDFRQQADIPEEQPQGNDVPILVAEGPPQR